MNLLVSNKSKIIFFLIIILISFYRSPYIFLEGRFFGEEGELWFKSAYENNFFKHFSYFAEIAGYYNLIVNLLTELSTYVPLIYAPLVTVYGSFIIILIPILLILFKDSYLFKNDKQKFVGCLIFFITYPHVPEIWLNSVNSQIYLFFISLLILYLKPSDKKNKILMSSLLFLSGMSGIYSCSLTPLYLLKYYFTKTKNDLINSIILVFCSITQLSLIIYSKFSGKLYESIINPSFTIDGIINLIYNFFAKPIIGRQSLHFIYESSGLQNFGYISMLLIFLSIFVIIFFILLRSKFIEFFYKDYVLQSLLIFYALIFMIVILGADNFQTSGRYAAIPGVLFLLIIFRIGTNFNSKTIANFFSILLLISIITGFYEFRPNVKNIYSNHHSLKNLDCLNCPNWQEEVKRFREDNSYQLKIWPYDNKAMQLN